MANGEDKNKRIDFVITWVDCGDPMWQKMYTDFTGKELSGGENRYRDWGFLKYWFRAVEKYAPWVGNIFFITCGQKPDFLNVNHPKLKFIKHEDYIDKKYLPTFNSNVIELNLGNISELSEQFVLFNDDIYINAPIKEEDAFVNGVPCDCAVLDMVIPMGKNDVFYHAIINNIDIINKHYDKKKVVKSNKKSWYKPTYKEGFIRNICLSPWKYFGGFKDYHLVNNFLKSSFTKLREMEPEAFERTFKNHFRGWDDITQYVVRYYQLCEGKFHPARKEGKFYEIGRQTDEIVKALSEEQHKFICMNDNSDNIDFETNRKKILEAFEKKFPEKSSFEL